MASNTMEFKISNMKCGGCVTAIEDALNATADVETVAVSLENEKAVVASALSADEIAKIITDAGFPATAIT